MEYGVHINSSNLFLAVHLRASQRADLFYLFLSYTAPATIKDLPKVIPVHSNSMHKARSRLADMIAISTISREIGKYNSRIQ